MARPRISKGAGPAGLALAAWDVWRRLSPSQRRFVTKMARKHGVKIARVAVKAGRARRKLK